jgi:hypothetical protein
MHISNSSSNTRLHVLMWGFFETVYRHHTFVKYCPSRRQYGILWPSEMWCHISLRATKFHIAREKGTRARAIFSLLYDHSVFPKSHWLKPFQFPAIADSVSTTVTRWQGNLCCIPRLQRNCWQNKKQQQKLCTKLWLLAFGWIGTQTGHGIIEFFHDLAVRQSGRPNLGKTHCLITLPDAGTLSWYCVCACFCKQTLWRLPVNEEDWFLLISHVHDQFKLVY